MRFHLPALIGQPVIRANSSCAYTQKVRRFANMMVARGHEVFLYAGTDRDCDMQAEQVDVYGITAPVEFDPPAWTRGNAAVIGAMADRVEPGDVVCLIAGRCQETIASAFPDNRAVEFGIGYGGSFAPFRVFESYAWMHTTYAAQGGGDAHALDGRAFDAVIPNYFDPADFPIGAGEGDNLLYVGRLIERKGVEVAVNVARLTGMALFLAGEGDHRPGEGEAGITYVGSIGPEDRASLMGDARALLAPTTYIEPFGGVVVEAALCGTPAITTDWGAFPETVAQGVTGYRCRRLGEFVWAAQHAGDLDREAIAARARALYSTEVVAERYEAYFAHLATLDDAGWYDPTPAAPGLATPA